jgi:DcmR-like sensory protein
MRGSHRGDADLRWLPTGHHVCHFFGTADDLSEVLVPYFKAGLEHRESCVWIASGEYGAERASSEMRAALADFDAQVAAGQIQVIGEGEWYAQYGTLSIAESVQLLITLKDRAMASGQAGLRISGHFRSWHQNMWDEFLAYELIADKAFKGHPISALCSYCSTECSGNAVLDVMERHELGLAKQRGRWKPIERGSRRPRSPRAVRARARRSSSKQEVDIIDLVEEQLGPYLLAYPARIALNGGHVALQASAADRLRPALSELVDNAVRHGALAAPQGRLVVTWHLAVNGSRRLHVEWAEHGMPGLIIPERLGRGTHIIAAAVENCVRTCGPDGMRWAFALGV